MAKEDYTTTRGALKLKGVKDAGVDKKKKKKKQKAKDDGAGTQLATTSGDGEGADEEETSAVLEPAGDEAREPYRGNRDDGKTEAERRYEETRRRRVSSLSIHTFYSAANSNKRNSSTNDLRVRASKRTKSVSRS